MLADNLKYDNNNFQNYSSDETDKSASIENVIRVIKKCIPSFIKTVLTKTNYNENLFTQDLVIECNNLCKYASYKFTFLPQYINPEKKANTIDIGVYIDITKNIFFEIEAKRLPNAKNSGRNDEDYVYSDGNNENGGIERFKKNVHGVDAPICGMIAYIQEYDFKYWLKLVNTWINNKVTKKVISNTLQWNKSEKLKVINTKLNSYQELRSKHSRIKSKKSKEIELRHIWINLN